MGGHCQQNMYSHCSVLHSCQENNDAAIFIIILWEDIITNGFIFSNPTIRCLDQNSFALTNQGSVGITLQSTSFCYLEKYFIKVNQINKINKLTHNQTKFWSQKPFVSRCNISRNTRPSNIFKVLRQIVAHILAQSLKQKSVT